MTRFLSVLTYCVCLSVTSLGCTERKEADSPKGNAPAPADQSGAPAPTPKEPAKKSAAFETIQFDAADGLSITADLYVAQPVDAPFITLFHQAGFSRGEYREIAPKLNSLGFNCMAVDQRSGKGVNGVENETAKRARAQTLDANYLDALPDMEAALHLVRARYPKAKSIAWGSSYSAALVLVLAGEKKDLIDGVLAFSPGEYFARFGKPKNFVRKATGAISVPVFLTAAQNEATELKAIGKAITAPGKQLFVPNTAGNHGSKALWAEKEDSAAYWTTVRTFLATL